MRILLVKPAWSVPGGVYRVLHDVRFTPLHLGILAALSEGHDVTCVDGDRQEIPYGSDFDLVGITATTFTSERAYEIAARFRQKGAKVVMGGVHPSILPEECLEHSDAVVVGEAEYVWPELLKDAARDALKRTYRCDTPVAMDDVPFPRRDLLGESEWFACVQATRGCPNRCRYCYLPTVPWHAWRSRSVDLVLREVESCPQDVIFFVDDNLFADRKYALELCRKMGRLNKLWSVQAPTTVAGDEELLRAMSDSGCFYVPVGFQTVNADSLEWARVQNRVEEYARVVRRFHAHGILVGGFFILGFDDDGPGIFRRTSDVIKAMDLDVAHLYILTPYPGTEFYDELKSTGRLLDGKDRLNYGWANAVFRPKLMSPEALERGVESASARLQGFFRRKLPATVLKRLSWSWRHPSLLGAAIRGAIRQARGTKES